MDEESVRSYGGRYVLSEQLSVGVDREVWRAHDDVVSRPVALKLFRGESATDPEWLRTFDMAADRLGALSHPGIARVLDHGEGPDAAWLVMSLVPGRRLSDRIAEGGWLSAQQVLDIIGQTALALGAAHDAGIAHGNLAADNLLVRDTGVVTLIGFGVDGRGTRQADLDALGSLAATLLSRGEAGSSPELSTSPHAADVKKFMTSFAEPSRRDPGLTAAMIGRDALALALALGGGAGPVTPVPLAGTGFGERRELRPTPGPSYDEAERRMVRNRLLVLGTIVVVGGAALLRFVGEGAGDVTVPAVTNLPVDQAKLQLTRDGLRSTERCILGVDSGGTISTQAPAAGHEVKAGSVVTLTLTRETCS